MKTRDSELRGRGLITDALYTIPFLLALILIIAIGCARTPPECAAYCEQIEKWSTQCKKPKFSQESCLEHFRSGQQYIALSMRCWQMMLSWSPDPQAEFNCETTKVPDL